MKHIFMQLIIESHIIPKIHRESGTVKLKFKSFSRSANSLTKKIGFSFLAKKKIKLTNSYTSVDSPTSLKNTYAYQAQC